MMPKRTLPRDEVEPFRCHLGPTLTVNFMITSDFSKLYASRLALPLSGVRIHRAIESNWTRVDSGSTALRRHHDEPEILAPEIPR